MTTSLIDRGRAAALGQETVRILEAGFYVSPAGRRVGLRTALDRARAGTVPHAPDDDLPWPAPDGQKTEISIVNSTTLSVAARLFHERRKPGVLNFASATTPGGGFLAGALAQEESLARSSGLFACLDGQAMYAFHRTEQGNRRGLYTRYALYSPEIPVLRDDSGELLEQPWSCDVLTCAAVDASKAELFYDPGVISDEMRNRIDRVLQVFAHKECETLVLGAWGCGAFGNDADMVAAHFRQSLDTRFRGVFARIVFAITDWSDNRRFIGPFERAFQVSSP